jgi:hypothetical protein
MTNEFKVFRLSVYGDGRYLTIYIKRPISTTCEDVDIELVNTFDERFWIVPIEDYWGKRHNFFPKRIFSFNVEEVEENG